MTRLPRVALACLALALGGAAVAACGDDDNASSADTQPPAAEPAVTATTDTSDSGGGAASAPVVVTMKANQNTPGAIDVKVDQQIEWRNEDGYAHTVTSTSGEKIDSGNFTDSFEYAPKQAGKIDYVCTIHSGQGGNITVTDHAK